MNRNVVNRLFWGLFIAGLGVLFLLQQTGFFPGLALGALLAKFWPCILILLGLQSIIVERKYGGGWWGSVLLLLGCYFLVRNLGLISLSLGDLIRVGWPVVLIIIGINMIFRPGRGSRDSSDEEWKAYPDQKPERPVPPAPPLHPDPLAKRDTEEESHGYGYGRAVPPRPEEMNGQYGNSGDAGYGEHGQQRGMGSNQRNQRHANERVEWWDSNPKTQTRSSFIGDIHLGQDYWELKPLNISHFIGDTVIDLTKAQIAPGETKITVSSFIGDVKVFIPNDYEVGFQVVSSAFIGDAKVLDRKEGGIFSHMNIETPYYHECDKRIRLVVSSFIGDVRVTKVG
ncbi:cell wall-active antibiotics response protein LiaF [Paenibacillus tarimensis]|uniref:cell wall-active antibiotics response protein LiaF n=1 Tax=Paenibacillus tarimensis TaxID=416012 RepID=UPI001F23DAFA|nr:cell wall-active antibiotics response protein LiaF [Paenibacillus tarimensis]MCF2943815.1 cell wall-active antibiotics response protein LiaF [Paenibacillus tarimensis]